MTAVSTFDTYGALVILAILAAIRITDRARARRFPQASPGTARLPDDARQGRRVEAGTFDALYGDPGPYTRTPGGKR